MSIMAKRKNKKPPKGLPQILYDIRTSLGFSQEKMAEEVSVSLSTWTSWEIGRRTPSPISLRLLKELYPDFFKKGE